MSSITAHLAALLVHTLPTPVQELVFRDVNVVPVDSEVVVPGQSVVVKDGWIVALGATREVALPAGAQVIEGAGLYLMPGLADMHVHLPREPYEGYGTEEFLLLQVACGVTAVRSMRGAREDLDLRRRVEAGEVIGPRLYLSAPPIASSTVPGDAGRLVAGWKEEGYDLVKTLSVPDVKTYEAVCLGARAAGMSVAGHVPAVVGLSRVLELGQDSIEHLQGLHEAFQASPQEAREWIAEVVRRGVYNCPTLDWYQITYMQLPLEELQRRPGLEYLPADLVSGWIQGYERTLDQREARPAEEVAQEIADDKRNFEDRLALVAALDEAGALLLASPDATGSFGVPGFGLRRELELLARAGLSPYACLRAATRNAGLYLGAPWGVVATGMRADLLLLDANPLDSVDNVRRIEGVMVNSRWLSKEWIGIDWNGNDRGGSERIQPDER